MRRAAPKSAPMVASDSSITSGPAAQGGQPVCVVPMRLPRPNTSPHDPNPKRLITTPKAHAMAPNHPNPGTGMNQRAIRLSARTARIPPTGTSVTPRTRSRSGEPCHTGSSGGNR